MRPLSRLVAGRKASMSFGGGDGSWARPPFWSWGSQSSEQIDHNFEGFIAGAYKANGPIFACILARMCVFSEVRFQFQSLRNGRPAELFGLPSLSILERPWPGGTTGELLARMEQDVSLAGNFYGALVDEQGRPVSGPSGRGVRVRRLRPDWVKIITGIPGVDEDEFSPWDVRARVVGYLYTVPVGSHRPDPLLLLPDQVVHYSPLPDPDAQWRGMSWIASVIDEIKGDKAATKHKLKFFEHGGSGGIYIKYAEGTAEEEIRALAELWKEQHEGAGNAYRTFHLGGGADAKTLGADLKQLDFKVTQGAGETRIAAASGVGAVMAQLSEGLQGSSLNAGNYSSARRRFADGLMRPLWRTAAASLESIVPPPAGSRLWYDARDVSFLQEDAKDDAEIVNTNASAIGSLVTNGFTAESAVAAVTTGDLSLLVHSGLLSVQMQPPGSGEPDTTGGA